MRCLYNYSNYNNYLKHERNQILKKNLLKIEKMYSIKKNKKDF